jgi:hypothetical protein
MEIRSMATLPPCSRMGRITTVRQQGDRNVVSIEQFGDMNSASVRHQGSDNDATSILQDGERNNASVVFAGGSNEAQIRQVGDRNLAIVGATNHISSNSFEIDQLGDRNRANHQVRSHNAFGNEVLIYQIGSDNRAFTSMSSVGGASVAGGNLNSIDILQDGSGNLIGTGVDDRGILQIGDGKLDDGTPDRRS